MIKDCIYYDFKSVKKGVLSDLLSNSFIINEEEKYGIIERKLYERLK